MINLIRTTNCECGEEMTVSVKEVLTFDSIECPNCGTDVYHSEAQLDEAYELDEDKQDYSDLNPSYHLKEVIK